MSPTRFWCWVRTWSYSCSMTNVDCFEHEDIILEGHDKDINLEGQHKDPVPVSQRSPSHLYNPPGHTGVQGVHTSLRTNPANIGSLGSIQGGKTRCVIIGSYQSVHERQYIEGDTVSAEAPLVRVNWYGSLLAVTHWHCTHKEPNMWCRNTRWKEYSIFSVKVLFVCLGSTYENDIQPWTLLEPNSNLFKTCVHSQFSTQKSIFSRIFPKSPQQSGYTVWQALYKR